MCNIITCNASYWAWSESLISPAFPNSARLEPTDPPRCIPPEVDLWCRHLKEPTCVVGEQRQFHLPLEDFFAAACWDVGDTSMWEFFLKVFISISGMFRLTFGGFWSTLGSMFLLSILLILGFLEGMQKLVRNCSWRIESQSSKWWN